MRLVSSNIARAVAISLGLIAISFAAMPSVESAKAEESAGIVFLAKSTSKSPNELWGAKVDGSSPFFIASAVATVGGNMSDPALSPDGREVAVAYANNVGVINVETGKLTAVYTGPTKNNPTADQPHWSPSGDRLIFVADISTASQEALHGHVYTVTKTGGGLKELSFPLGSGQTRIRSISYSPSGRRVVYVSYNNQAKSGRINTARLDGTDSRFVYADPGGSTATTALRDTVYSPDGGSILFRRLGDPFSVQVHRIPADGGTDLQLTDEEVDPGSNDGGTWLPNGSQIAYTSDNYHIAGTEEELHIKVMDADGENPERLLTGFYWDWDPSFRQPELDKVLEAQDLLSEYSPDLWYDSQENYRADSAASITDLWGDEEGGVRQTGEDPYTNVLWDADGFEKPGTGDELARSEPELEPGQFALSLSNLGSTYPTSLKADENDWLDERNGHYSEDNEHLEVLGYADHIYGHAVTDFSGQLWLQYWFFYYYNAFSYLGVGDHEGDWEMIQIGLDKDRQPTEVVFSQHTYASLCSWEQVLSVPGGGPQVFPGLGSHASYPQPGTWETDGPLDDNNDGEGLFIHPEMAVITDGDPGWLDWPGHWGNSRGGGLNSASPVGPERHSQWSDPGTFAEEAEPCYDRFKEAAPKAQAETRPGKASGLPAAPEILSTRIVRGDRVQIDYRLGEPIGGPSSLLVSVDTEGDDISPHTLALSHPKLHGHVDLPLPTAVSGDITTIQASLVTPEGRSPVARHVFAR
jgi:Tol biopolymer transport system component